MKNYYKTKYGLTIEEVEEMRSTGCGICKVALEDVIGGRWNNLHIDHDHKTGKVRGVLCSNCNVAIGHFRDDPKLLQEALNYLERNLD